MIVAKVSRGSSFKGIAAYLCGTREDQHRALWSATQNVGIQNMEIAARFMAASAMDADELKRQNGWDGRGRGTTKKPVYHAIMSWPEGMSPDIAHQEQAAREMLMAAGYDEAQALLVGHNDNGKTHVHIVVNLLHPETGKQFSGSNDYRKMQAWALDYCNENGIDTDEIAPNRKKNAERREQAKEQNRPLKNDELEGTKRLSRAEWNRMRAALAKRHETQRTALRKCHAEDWGFAKTKIAAAKTENKRTFRREYAHQKRLARERNKPYWRDLFQRQRFETDRANREVIMALEQSRRANTIMGRILSLLPFTIDRATASANLTIAKLNMAQLFGKHAQEKSGLAKRLSEQTFDRTINALPDRKRVDLTDMKDRHAQDWQKLREQQDVERKAVAKEKERARHDRERERYRDRQRRMKQNAKAKARLDWEKEREKFLMQQRRDRDRDRDKER